MEPAPAPISLYYSLLSFNVLVAVSGLSQPRDPAPDSILIYDSSPSFKAPEIAPEYNRILDLMTDTILFSYFLLLSNVREYSNNNKNNFSTLSTFICRSPKQIPLFNRTEYYTLSVMGPVNAQIYNRYLDPATDTFMFVFPLAALKVPLISQKNFAAISTYACSYPVLIPLANLNYNADLYVVGRSNCNFSVTILEDELSDRSTDAPPVIFTTACVDEMLGSDKEDKMEVDDGGEAVLNNSKPASDSASVADSDSFHSTK